MASTAELNLGGKTYKVLSYDYSLERNADPDGQFSSNIRNVELNLVVETSGTAAILAAMLDKVKFNDGFISFFSGGIDGEVKKIEWEKGYIKKYKEMFKADETMKIAFTVSAETITDGEALLQQDWRTIGA